MLRNNLDYIKEQLAREEKFVRKEIEQIKLEQQFCMIVCVTQPRYFSIPLYFIRGIILIYIYIYTIESPRLGRYYP